MLNEHEAREAASAGWQLCRVYDDRRGRVALAILPMSFERLSAPDAVRIVVELARRHDRLALKALAMVSQSNMPQKPTKPKKAKKK